MVRGSSPTTVTSYEPRSPRTLAAHDQRMLLPSAAVGPVQRKCTSVAKYFRLPITSITLRPGILAGLSARALAEALPSALPKASSIPAAGDEEGEGLGVLGSGDSEGGSGDRRVSRRLPDRLPLWKHADEPGRRCHEKEERRYSYENRQPDTHTHDGPSPRRYGHGH